MQLERFGDPRLGRRILDRIRRKARRVYTFMEVCGTHTMAFSRSGIRDLLKDCVDLVSGPGCPVCVTDNEDIDRMIALARVPGAIVTTFGDMMRVPGSRSNLFAERAQGRDVRVVYSPLEAVKVAAENPDRPVIFLGVGFETTVPAVTLALRETWRQGLANFYLYSAHKLVPPAMRALLEAGGATIEGFLCPGHVSTVLGRKGFAFLAEDYGVSAAIAGFEPVDLLMGVEALIDLVNRGEAAVVNTYGRAVLEEGNAAARAAIDEFFQPAAVPWRGLGTIPSSGLKLRPEFAAHDAEAAFPIRIPPPVAHSGCGCGDVLRGLLRPPDCPLFGTACDPSRPVGPCMVSSEGACAAYYRYGKRKGG